MIHSMENLPLHERLRELNLPSLDRRKGKGEVIEVFELMKGIIDTSDGYTWILSSPPCLCCMYYNFPSSCELVTWGVEVYMGIGTRDFIFMRVEIV